MALTRGKTTESTSTQSCIDPLMLLCHRYLVPWLAPRGVEFLIEAATISRPPNVEAVLW